MRISVPITIAVLFFPASVWAGAWTLAPGEGQFIVSSGRETAPVAAIFEGLPREDKTDLRVHLEYGLLDDLTLGASASAKWSRITNELDLRVGAHARYRVWQSPSGGVYSVQVGASVPISDWVGPQLATIPAEAGPEAEVRLLYGRSWLGDWGKTFLNVEAAYRWRADEEDEIHLDTTLGHALSRRFMVLGSVWARVPVTGGDPSLKIAPSVAWTMWPSLGPNDKKPDIAPPRTLQFGIAWDALNPDDGIGFTLSIWNRF